MDPDLWTRAEVHNHGESFFFYIRKFPGHILFQIRLELLVSFWPQTFQTRLPLLLPPRCVYFSLSSPPYIFNTLVGGSLPKCSSDHVAPLLGSFTIKVGPFTLAQEAFLSCSTFISPTSSPTLSYSNTAANSIVHSWRSCFMPLSLPGATLSFSLDDLTLIFSLSFPFT